MRFIYHHRTRGSGVEGVHIRGIADGLEQLGHPVAIVSPPGVEVAEPGDRQEVGTGPPGRSALRRLWDVFSRHCPEFGFEVAEAVYSLVALPRLVRACRRLRPDAIYERYAFFNAAGLLAARACGVPLLLEVNDSVAVERERRGNRLVLGALARLIERRVFRGAGACFVVSNYLRDLLTAQGVASERILVTPNAIDPGRFDPARAAAVGLRARLGLEGRVVIGFVGSFLSWHGIELLMRVVPPVLQRFPNAAFLMVGDGSRREPAEKEAAAHGVANRVVFTGQVPHSAVPEYMAAMDVGLMPHSNRFGSPVKIFEYMAMGVVPVGPRLGPLEEAIDHGENGLLFTPEDETGLREALERLLADPALRARLGAAARATVLARHLWTHNAAAIADRAFALQRLPDGAASAQGAPALRTRQ
jgi:glycosyltransferase involved in cell wall biosynthesis